MGTLVTLIFILLSCRDPDPREAILEALQKDPAAAIEAAEAIEDPLERTVIITQLVEEFPHRTRPLCDALPTEIAKERCIRLNQRPHLWKPQKDHLKLQPTPITPLQEACSIDPHPTTCRTAQAQQFAKAKQADKAKQACEAISEERWKAECYFTISEDLSTHIDLYKEAIDACDHSRQFAKSCWHHSVMGLAQRAEQNWNNWSWHAEIIRLIDETWTIKNPKMNRELQSHFWAQSIHRHVEQQQLQLEGLPPEALAHYRTSQAIRAIRFSTEALQHLETWVMIASAPTMDTRKKPRGFASEMDLWLPQDPPENSAVISYLGNSHRLSHSDDNIDWNIAILEASARLRPLNKLLILEGQNHPHPAVKATAQRLAQIDLLAAPDQQTERK